MKKPNALLAQLAQAKPNPITPPSLSEQAPTSAVTYQPTILVGKEAKAKDAGMNKGIWLRSDEDDMLQKFRRKLYLDGLEVSQNLLIRALIHDLEDNPRVVDHLRRLQD